MKYAIDDQIQRYLKMISRDIQYYKFTDIQDRPPSFRNIIFRRIKHKWYALQSGKWEEISMTLDLKYITNPKYEITEEEVFLELI